VLVCLVSESYGQVCGVLLRQGPDSDAAVPMGWQMCYIDQRDSRLYNDTCTQLIQGLPVYNNAQGLMNAGGNFGCWNLVSYPNSDQYFACNNDFQHNVKVSDCLRCSSMAVCIRYPEVEKKIEDRGSQN